MRVRFWSWVESWTWSVLERDGTKAWHVLIGRRWELVLNKRPPREAK